MTMVGCKDSRCKLPIQFLLSYFHVVDKYVVSGRHHMECGNITRWFHTLVPRNGIRQFRMPPDFQNFALFFSPRNLFAFRSIYVSWLFFTSLFVSTTVFTKFYMQGLGWSAFLVLKNPDALTTTSCQ